MSSTYTLAQSIAWCQPFLNYAPVLVGVNSEPAITSANVVIQTILAPPFTWRWNRKSLIYSMETGQQDSVQSMPDFGFLERASVWADKMYELTTKPSLGDSSETARPEFIATQLDDGSGNITLRAMPAPDANYEATVTYQKVAPAMTSTAATWFPIPDYMMSVYNWGLLSFLLELVDPPRAARARQIFVSSLLATSEGLTEQEKNVFLAGWLGDVRQEQTSQMSAQLGVGARRA